MALYVDWSRCKPTLTDQEQETAFSVGVVMCVTGVPHIETLSDVQEIMARLAFYERLAGKPTLQNANGDNVGLMPGFWIRWLGVKVNGQRETRNRWISRMSRQFFDEYRVTDMAILKAHSDAHNPVTTKTEGN